MTQSSSAHAFVAALPDLIDGSEYASYPAGGLVRLRITVTESGVELLGDGMRPELIERLLASVDSGVLEQMLCG
jgi:FtsH ternary system-associated peptide